MTLSVQDAGETIDSLREAYCTDADRTTFSVSVPRHWIRREERPLGVAVAAGEDEYYTPPTALKGVVRIDPDHGAVEPRQTDICLNVDYDGGLQALSGTVEALRTVDEEVPPLYLDDVSTAAYADPADAVEAVDRTAPRITLNFREKDIAVEGGEVHLGSAVPGRNPDLPAALEEQDVDYRVEPRQDYGDGVARRRLFEPPGSRP